MTPNRSEPTRCRIRGCVCIGFFAAFDDRCPMHRGSEWDPPRTPTTAEFLTADDNGGG